MDALNLRGWRPIRLYRHAQTIWVDWARLADAPLLRPFYQDSLGELLRLPFHNAFRRQTPLQTLLDWQTQSPGRTADLLVFHVSRCGSTLIAQALAQSPHHLVLSEAPPVDFLMREALEAGWLDEAQAIHAVQAWLSAWAQRSEAASPALHAVTLKLDAWNTHCAPLLGKAWPHALQTFLIREPIAVLVSQMTERGFFLVPGALGPKFGPPELSPLEKATLPPEAYCTQVIARIYADMARLADPEHALVLDHAELPAAIETHLLPRLRWQPSATEQDAMRARLGRHGKRPDAAFSDDAQRKRASASATLNALVEHWVAPHYRALLAKRASFAQGAPHICEVAP